LGWPFKSPRYVGKPVPRVEDRRFVTGNGVFVDDLRLPGMLYAAFVRSRVAHARIRSIETSKAERLNGVVAVLTAKDVDRLVGPVATDGGMEVPRAKPLASGKVRYYGEPVAMVIAEDRYLAYDAAELVEVEYERLEPVTDVEEALKEGAPLVHEELGSNVAFTTGRQEETSRRLRSSGRCAQVPFQDPEVGCGADGDEGRRRGVREGYWEARGPRHTPVPPRPEKVDR
jgi:xanthine dehydrogenase, molybdenum binding subunit apoprotein (EC 1.17.1.4)